MGLSRPFASQGFRPSPGRQAARDPNAMDVDAITTEERRELLNKKACFNCRKEGHCARDCRSPRRNQGYPPRYGSQSGNYVPRQRPPPNDQNNRQVSTLSTKKVPIQEAAVNIHSLLCQYTGEEEREIFAKFQELSIGKVEDFQ